MTTLRVLIFSNSLPNFWTFHVSQRVWKLAQWSLSRLQNPKNNRFLQRTLQNHCQISKQCWGIMNLGPRSHWFINIENIGTDFAGQQTMFVHTLDSEVWGRGDESLAVPGAWPGGTTPLATRHQGTLYHAPPAQGLKRQCHEIFKIRYCSSNSFFRLNLRFQIVSNF